MKNVNGCESLFGFLQVFLPKNQKLSHIPYDKRKSEIGGHHLEQKETEKKKKQEENTRERKWRNGNGSSTRNLGRKNIPSGES